MRICIISSNFYPNITNMLIDGASKKLKKNKITKFKTIIVPGTFEIPVVISSLIKKYDAFIVLGCVIKGETPHFHYLCDSIFNSIQNLSIKNKIPIGNGILTCNNKKQAVQRADPKKRDNGGNAAKAVISLLNIIKK